MYAHIFTKLNSHKVATESWQVSIEYVHVITIINILVCFYLVYKFFPPLFSPDPSLTAENVYNILGVTPRDWERVRVVLGMPLSKRDLIEREYSTETQRRQAAVDRWLRYSPTASWKWLAGRLYLWEERNALEAVSQYIHKKTAGIDILLLLLFNSVQMLQYHSKSFCLWV